MELYDLASDACKDVHASLQRRHETLAENYALISKLPGGVAVQGEDTRKYAAAVVEYTQKKKKGAGKKLVGSCMKVIEKMHIENESFSMLSPKYYNFNFKLLK